MAIYKLIPFISYLFVFKRKPIIVWQAVLQPHIAYRKLIIQPLGTTGHLVLYCPIQKWMSICRHLSKTYRTKYDYSLANDWRISRWVELAQIISRKLLKIRPKFEESYIWSNCSKISYRYGLWLLYRFLQLFCAWEFYYKRLNHFVTVKIAKKNRRLASVT